LKAGVWQRWQSRSSVKEKPFHKWNWKIKLIIWKHNAELLHCTSLNI
jgi:hypothetical protein